MDSFSTDRFNWQAMLIDFCVVWYFFLAHQGLQGIRRQRFCVDRGERPPEVVEPVDMATVGVPVKCQTHSQFSSRQSDIVHQFLEVSPEPLV